MGGGVAWRAAAKVAGMGVLTGGLRGGENPVVSAARQASRSVASVVSSSDDVKLAIANNDSKTNSSVEKPMPRLVFGGAPSIQEAKQAVSDLNDVLEKTYLSPNATNGQKSLLLLHSEHVETKPFLVSETSVTPLASKHVIQALRLLHENAAAQNVVASLASDPNVWNAVQQNEVLMDFLQTHKTRGVFPGMDPNVNDPFVKSPQANESKSASGKGFMDYVVDIKQKITVTKQKITVTVVHMMNRDIKQKVTVTVVDMMNRLSDTFETLFGGLAKGQYAANPDRIAGTSVEKTTIGGTFIGLAIMVIMVVVLKCV